MPLFLLNTVLTVCVCACVFSHLHLYSAKILILLVKWGRFTGPTTSNDSRESSP